MTVSEIIATRIRELCQDREISINKLSIMSGIPRTTLESILTGRSLNPSIICLIRIANTFNMTVSEFLSIPSLDSFSFDDAPDEE